MIEWKPAKTAPKDGTYFVGLLLFTHDKPCHQIDIIHWDGYDWEGENYQFNDREFVKWFPIPKIPEIKHYCENPQEYKSILACEQIKDSLFIRHADGSMYIVKYCPFCGFAI